MEQAASPFLSPSPGGLPFSYPPHGGGAGGGYHLRRSVPPPPAEDTLDLDPCPLYHVPLMEGLPFFCPPPGGGAGGGCLNVGRVCQTRRFGLLGEQSLQQPPPSLRATSASGGHLAPFALILAPYFPFFKVTKKLALPRRTSISRVFPFSPAFSAAW